MTLRKPKLVLIDLDGTLVDSVPDLAWCVDRMMEHVGRQPHGETKARDWIGNGVERLVRRALVGQLNGEPEQAEFERAYPFFLDLYARNTAVRSQLYPGVLQGLEFLQQQDLHLGCVTNKAGSFTRSCLHDLGILARFETVIAGDDLPKKKPDPLPLLHAAEQFGLAPEQCLMIGDSQSDVKAARAAGFQIVCVSYGYNHGEDIRDYSPDAVIDSMAELAGLLS